MVKYQLVEEEKPIHLTPPSPAIILKDLDFDNIDYDRISNSSEFKRFVYMIRTGKTHRGTKEDLDRKLKDTQEVIDVVKELKRGSTSDYRIVINEMKSKLAKQKAKIESSK